MVVNQTGMREMKHAYPIDNYTTTIGQVNEQKGFIEISPPNHYSKK
jgi:hypothetical protein